MSKNMKYLMRVLCAIVCLHTVSSGADSTRTFHPQTLRNCLPALSLEDTTAVTPSFANYFRYYNLKYPHCSHRFGFFATGDYTVAAQIFEPDSVRGTVFLLHGYFDHTGILSNLIKLCLQEHWCVAVFDLPGHGLSSGEPAAINSFADYSMVLEAFITLCAPYVPSPMIAIGHSTGSAVLVDYGFTRPDNPFQRIVLLAPLVRSSFWNGSKVGYAISKTITGYLPRWFRNSSHDNKFLAWFRRDPLQVDYFPLTWAAAAYDWESAVTNAKPRRLPVDIIQGTADETVDWRYNVPFLLKKIPGSSVHYVTGARHQLVNEAQPWRGECLTIITDILRNTKRPSKKAARRP
jgi:alpha-beta hydrolase superfamily lysophospholipase